MDMEWANINYMRVTLSGGKWRSCDIDTYHLSVIVLDDYKKRCREQKYNILEELLGVTDIVHIIRSYESDDHQQDMSEIVYDTPEESAYHSRVIAQIKSWNSTNNPAYSALFINNLKHLTDYQSMVHNLSMRDMEPINGYIMQVDSFFEPVDCMYLMTDLSELGRIVGMGVIIDDPQSILLIVNQRVPYRGYDDRIYKIDQNMLRTNTQCMMERRMVMNHHATFDNIYQLLQNIGRFYARLIE